MANISAETPSYFCLLSLARELLRDVSPHLCSFLSLLSTLPVVLSCAELIPLFKIYPLHLSLSLALSCDSHLELSPGLSLPCTLCPILTLLERICYCSNVFWFFFFSERLYMKIIVHSKKNWQGYHPQDCLYYKV